MKNNLVLEKRLVGIGKTFVQKGVEYEHVCKWVVKIHSLYEIRLG